MANIKSAKKRILVNASNAEENKSVKSKISTYSKKFNIIIEKHSKCMLFLLFFFLFSFLSECYTIT